MFLGGYNIGWGGVQEKPLSRGLKGAVVSWGGNGPAGLTTTAAKGLRSPARGLEEGGKWRWGERADCGAGSECCLLF